jgi:peptidoglycan/xylan/chitin deacetylase (PgdA/CDA1 family)
MKRLLSLLFHDVYAEDPAESGFSGSAADRYKLPLADFDAYLRVLDAALVRAPLCLPGEPLGLPQGAGTQLAFTVDDGGLSYYTQVAERLEARGWRGHCFVTTAWIGRRGFLEKSHIRELHARGHVIGSHSASHPQRFGACSWQEMLQEWDVSRKALQDILGSEVRAASVPGGYFTSRVARAAAAAGLSLLFTSEPEVRLRTIEGCRVAGRFTVRRGYPPELLRQLALRNPGVLLREWSLWNGKGLLKALLGSGYPRFADWLSRKAGGSPEHV